jgi:hypothetical protein
MALRPAPANFGLVASARVHFADGPLTIPGPEAYIRFLGAPPLGAMVRCEAPTDHSVTSVRLRRMRRLRRLVRAVVFPRGGGNVADTGP